MTIRDGASIPLAVSSLTFNYWWHHVMDQVPAAAGFVLPILGGVLVLLQIAYYFKMLRK